MKVTINLDCSAEELRRFFGLPDVQPLQQEMLDQLAVKMREGAAGMDVMNLMKPFLAPNTQAMDAMQKAFMQGFGLGGGARKDDQE